MNAAIIGAILGGLLRLAPEALKFFTAMLDRRHEYRMTKLNIEGQKELGSMRIDGAEAATQIKLDTTGLDALLETVKLQAKPMGIRWVDALSATVRPVLTYWLLAVYTMVKVAILWGTGGAWSAWSEADMALLGGAVHFWMLDRTIFKQRGR